MPPSPSPRSHGTEPPIRDRGDACPGALRLHSAADGHLARVRLPAGDLTVRQAEALADAADRLGDGHLSLTSRGNAELRGLPDGCGAQLAALLRDAGLLPSERHERIRNILASPLAGLDRHTPADVRLWARDLDRLLCASNSATALSGRFLFVLDDGRGDVATLGGDVSLVAEGGWVRGPAESGAPVKHGDLSGPGCPAGFGGPAEHGGPSGSGCPDGAGVSALLRVGDDPAALRIAGPDVPRAALAAAEAFLAAAEASGSGAWRVRELPDGYGLTARVVAERLHAAGIGATYVAGASGGAPQVATASAPYTTPAPYTAPVPYTAPAPYADSSAPGVIEGADGERALSVLAPLGRLSVAQWRLLTGVADADGVGALRLTPWRGIVIPGLSADTADARLRELSDAGLITAPDSPWHRIGACTGRPGCAKSRTDVRADATASVRAGTPVPAAAPVPVAVPVDGPAPVLCPGDIPGPDDGPVPGPGPGPGSAPGPGEGEGEGEGVPSLAPGEPRPDKHALRHLPVYWSGCERRCGHPHGAWVDVLATADGYRVSVVRPESPPAARPAPAAPATATSRAS
ncbi:cobalamin biosynthesis protein CobG [Streptomyces tubercidicus]|uniref:cobalamin biosynthesis protein CobG n=1 Tax=Streptomyces tubercidicus TaxID=47759 RepID=UPI0036762DA8